jgi:hypothetical protein
VRRCPHTYDDAAYVIGSLSTEERRAFVNHLPGCPECRASVRALSGLPGLLASVDTEETGVLGGAPLEPPPPSLWPRLLTSVQDEQARRRRRSRLLALAACLLVLMALAVPVALYAPFSPLQRTSGTTSVSMQAMTPVGSASNVAAEVGLDEKAWGTKVALHCSYADSRYAGEQSYGLFAVARSGEWEQIGSWTVGPGGEITTDAATKFRGDQLALLEIRRTNDGKPVLRRRI